MFHGWTNSTEACYYTEHWSIVRLDERDNLSGRSSEIKQGLHVVDDEEMWWEERGQQARRDRAEWEVDGAETISVELFEKVVDYLTEKGFVF